jgi:TonB-linked SusC/RagA family outer membrane protein
MRNGQPGYQNADIFIRGQATWADASAIIVVDGVERSDFGNIDPNEIESLNVLKDASSTAIFGVRGANGVILITTKTGKVSPAKVTYTGNVSANVFNDFAHIMNPYDGAVYTNEGLVAAGKSPMFTDAQLQKFKDGSDPIGYPDVDWTKYLMRKSTMQTQHNINVQGGTETVKYYVSMGYLYENGVFKDFPSPYGIKTNNDDSRYNFRSNLDFNLGKDLQIGLKLGGRFEKIYQPYSQTSAVLMAIISSIPRYAFPAYLSEGKLAMVTGASPFNANPLAMITRQGYTQTQKNTVESSINLNYKMNWLTDGLGFRSLLTFDNDLNGTRAQGGAFALYDFERESKLYKFPSGNFYDSPLGNVSTTSTGNMNYNLQVGFDYFREFGKHNVTGLLLGTRKLSQLTGAEPPNAIQGLAARITYNFNNKYLAEFSSAYNGSENFPKGQRYGFFPALTAGWIISNENFFQNQKVISFFKLKGSYGYSGNDRIGGSRFLFLNDYSTKTTTTAPVSSYSTPGDQVLFGDPNSLVKYPVVVHSRIGYPNVTWEKSLKRNIGFESSFFNRMLSINVDFFDEKRTNILLPRQSGLLTYGEAFPNVNFGETSNKGYEFELTFTKKVGEFTLGFYSQVSYARNKIISKDEPAGIPDYLKQEGKPIGQIFGYKTAGFFNSQEEINNWAVNKLGITYVGGIKFVDVNKDGVINSLDKCPIMNSLIPEYTFSFEPRVEWNGISFSATFQGVAKCSSDIIMNWSGYEFMNERWTPERYASGQKITWPSPANGWAVTNNDLILSNNEYIKLRNAELAWQLPKNIVEKMHLAGMRIFLTGQNLFTWTNFKYYIDPEVTLKSDYVKAYAYPTSRTYNLGVTVQF